MLLRLGLSPRAQEEDAEVAVRLGEHLAQLLDVGQLGELGSSEAIARRQQDSPSSARSLCTSTRARLLRFCACSTR
jgi:hypothetical protein